MMALRPPYTYLSSVQILAMISAAFFASGDENFSSPVVHLS